MMIAISYKLYNSFHTTLKRLEYEKQNSFFPLGCRLTSFLFKKSGKNSNNLCFILQRKSTEYKLQPSFLKRNFVCFSFFDLLTSYVLKCFIVGIAD